MGQKNNIELINSWNKLPNFVIIQGEQHTGKKYLTLYLCEKFKLYYKQVDASVKSVRSLINVMTENSNTLYHLHNFDKASLQAKNALLKVTEETPQGNYIVITGGPQIKTLESRARKIIMEPYSYNDMEPYIKNNIINCNNYLDVYRVGINTPAKVQYYKDCENLNTIIELAKDVKDKLTYITPKDILSIIGKFEDKYDELDECLMFLNMLVSLLEYDLKDKMYTSYTSILQIILVTKNRLLYEKTLRRKMLLFDMFYNIILVQKEQISSI